MTIKNALQNAYKGNLDIDNKDIDILMALTLHKKIEYIYTYPEKNISVSAYKKFNNLIKKRKDGWSIAYLQGFKYFYGHKFLVNKHTLVPRPDSEVIVDEVLKIIKPNDNVIDIGTGSGCLILSLAKNRPSRSPKADLEGRFTACDISKKALAVAKTNARKLNLKNTRFARRASESRREIQFIHSDVLNNVEGKFDIIMANLPYLTPQQMKEPSIKKEPVSALLSGKDGLDHYRELLKQLPNHLNKKYNIFLEIDPDQKDELEKIILKKIPKSKINFIKDLANNVRIVKISN